MTNDEPTAPPPPSPTWRRRALGWARDLAVFALIVLAINAWKTRNLLPDDTPLPESAVVYTLDGEPVPLSSFQPDAMMVHVWATWCSVCKVEHGALAALHDNLRDGEQLVTVAVSSGSAADVQAYLDDKGIDYPVYVAGDAFVDALRVQAYPTNYFVDGAGHIRARTVGATTRWGMQRRLRAATR